MNSAGQDIGDRAAPKLGLGVAVSLLTTAVAAAYPLYAWAAHARFGPPGLVTAATAAGVCWLGACLALACTSQLQRHSPVGGLLLGMLFRMGLPLAAGLVLDRTVPALAEAGVFGLIVAYYLLTLTVETLLAVRLIRPAVVQAPKAS